MKLLFNLEEDTFFGDKIKFYLIVIKIVPSTNPVYIILSHEQETKYQHWSSVDEKMERQASIDNIISFQIVSYLFKLAAR